MVGDIKKTTKTDIETESTSKAENSDTDVITVKTEPDTTKTDASTESDFIVEEEKDEKEGEKTIVPEADTKKVSSFSLIDADKTKEDLGVEENKNAPIISETKDTMNDKTESTENKGEISQNEVNKWIENYDEVNKTSPKKEKKGFKVVLIILLVLSFLAILAGGFIYYQKNISNKSGTSSSEETNEAEVLPTNVPTATPTEGTVVDLSDLNVQILNGSGIPGEAGSAKDLITSLDFNKIDTGNADNYDYTDTEISLKDDLSNQVYEDIKAKLDSTYNVVKSDSSVSSSSSYDVIIIVGTKK